MHVCIRTNSKVYCILQWPSEASLAASDIAVKHVAHVVPSSRTRRRGAGRKSRLLVSCLVVSFLGHAGWQSAC